MSYNYMSYLKINDINIFKQGNVSYCKLYIKLQRPNKQGKFKDYLKFKYLLSLSE